MEQLLRCGIEVNSTDGAISGNTVLHWAASYGDAATVRLILGEFMVLSWFKS